MKKTVFWTILAIVAVGSILITQKSLIGAQNENIEALKRESLSDGKIFDGYLIPYSMSPAKIEHFGGLEQANASYNLFNDLLEDSKGNEYMLERNNLKMQLDNFRTLTDTTGPATKVAALVLQERIQEGKYQQPELEPLKILHEYLIEKYPTVNAGEALTEMFGEMKALTPEIFDLVEKSTLLGNPSTELVLADMDYWITIRHYGDCIFVDEGDDCDKYLEEARERSLKKSNDGDAFSDVAFYDLPLPASPDA